MGFAIGFIGYLSFPNIAIWFHNVIPSFIDQSLIGAIVAGIIGSAISTITIVTWANKTSTY